MSEAMNFTRCPTHDGRTSAPVSSFGGCLTALLLFVVIVYVNVLCWDYSASFWLVYSGRPDNFTTTHAVIVSFIPGLGQFGLPVAAATYVLSECVLTEGDKTGAVVSTTANTTTGSATSTTCNKGEGTPGVFDKILGIRQTSTADATNVTTAVSNKGSETDADNLTAFLIVFVVASVSAFVVYLHRP